MLLAVLKLGRAGARAALALRVITITGARALLLLLLKTPLRRARWRRALSFCARCIHECCCYVYGDSYLR